MDRFEDGIVVSVAGACVQSVTPERRSLSSSHVRLARVYSSKGSLPMPRIRGCAGAGEGRWTTCFSRVKSGGQPR